MTADKRTALGCIAIAFLLASVCAWSQDAPKALPKDAVIPFDLVNNKILVQAFVGKTGPLWFIVDSGDKYAMVDIETAKSAGVEFGEDMPMHGGGSGAPARMVSSGSFRIVGLDNFTQPLFAAMPLAQLGRGIGHSIDGIIGYNFLSQFVTEIDYQKKQLILHDKGSFQYRGKGESLPIQVNQFGHFSIPAKVKLDASRIRDVSLIVDLGHPGALTLHTSFVNHERLLEAQAKTIAWLGAHGAGGEKLGGRVGRIPEVDLGSFKVNDPVITFAQVEDGPLASTQTQGTLGADILKRFRLFLDYGHQRLILEPTSELAEPFEYDMSGLHLMESDHTGFEVDEISDHSAAEDAGIRAGDILVAIDGKPAKDLTLGEVKEMFRQEKQYVVTVERGQTRKDVQLKLRRLI